VILAAWAAWGEDMLPRMNGMWGLAIWTRATIACSSRATASASSR